MELPKDIFLGMPLLSMEGNRTLCILSYPDRRKESVHPEIFGGSYRNFRIYAGDHISAMIERFLRFVNGSLLVCACGSNISRFLNLCARHEIMFWKIQPDSPTQVSFYIRLQDLYELRPYLRKTKTRIHIRKRIGFPSVRESGELKSKGIPLWEKTPFWNI